MEMTEERFLKGMTPTEHVGRMKVNRGRFVEVMSAVEIPQEDREYFADLTSPLRVAVVTEDWCGDHVSTVPVLYRLAVESGKLDVRVFMRDESWDLADAFLPPHRRDTVPVFAFFTGGDMRWIAVFIETSRGLVPVLDGMDDAIRDSLAHLPDIRADVNDMSQETRTALRRERGLYRVNHAAEWGRVISGDFRDVVADGLSRGPNSPPAEAGTEWPVPVA
ncbi:MAG: thioredoxin family protein [Dehalococcoidia bacterium]|nr:thioredoxin family protein [Dehalococcoidia bacterium]